MAQFYPVFCHKFWWEHVRLSELNSCCNRRGGLTFRIRTSARTKSSGNGSSGNELVLEMICHVKCLYSTQHHWQLFWDLKLAWKVLCPFRVNAPKASSSSRGSTKKLSASVFLEYSGVNLGQLVAISKRTSVNRIFVHIPGIYISIFVHTKMYMHIH